MAKKLIAQQSAALKQMVLDFLEQNMHKLPELVPVHENFDRILFVKSSDLKDPIEVYKLDWILKAFFPDHDYVIVASSNLNDLLHTEKIRSVYHVLRHIPSSFDGSLLKHENHGFFNHEIELMRSSR